MQGSGFDLEDANLIASAPTMYKRLKQYEGLTPQGSEFANCPENVYDHIKWRLDKELELAKKNVRLKRINTELLEACKLALCELDALATNMNEGIRYTTRYKNINQAIAKAEGR